MLRSELTFLLVQLELNVDTGGKLELHERIDRLIRRVDDVHDAFVRAQLELVARVLVTVRRYQQREFFHLGRQRHRALDRGARALGRLDDFLGGSVDEAMVESFEADADVLVGHGPNFLLKSDCVDLYAAGVTNYCLSSSKGTGTDFAKRNRSQ